VRPARHLACALGAVYLALTTVGCATDDDSLPNVADDCDDCEPGSMSGGGAGGSAGSAGTGASSGGNGGRSQPDDEDTEDPADDPDLDTGAAPGETGIFVGMTAAHNAARAQLGLDEALPDLQWSTELAEIAQDWSDNLTSECGTIEHRMPNSYGENIAMRGSTRLTQPFSPEEAVDGWNAEVACWDYGTISGTESCDAQCAAGLNSNGCGHYTQLVWRNTRRVGCGYSTCQGGQFTYEIWVCNYDPPGNYIGQTPY
jgi:hypothetical protein